MKNDTNLLEVMLLCPSVKTNGKGYVLVNQEPLSLKAILSFSVHFNERTCAKPIIIRPFFPPDLSGAGRAIFHHMAFMWQDFFMDGIDIPGLFMAVTVFLPM